MHRLGPSDSSANSYDHDSGHSFSRRQSISTHAAHRAAHCEETANDPCARRVATRVGRRERERTDAAALVRARPAVRRRVDRLTRLGRLAVRQAGPRHRHEFPRLGHLVDLVDLAVRARRRAALLVRRGARAAARPARAAAEAALGAATARAAGAQARRRRRRGRPVRHRPGLQRGRQRDLPAVPIVVAVLAVVEAAHHLRCRTRFHLVRRFFRQRPLRLLHHTLLNFDDDESAVFLASTRAFQSLERSAKQVLHVFISSIPDWHPIATWGFPPIRRSPRLPAQSMYMYSIIRFIPMPMYSLCRPPLCSYIDTLYLTVC